VVPVPERLTECGLPVALSEIVTDAMRLPLAEGLKVTLIVQAAPAVTLEPQLLVWVKSLALVPETAIEAMLKSAVPELVRVTTWAAPLVPTG
jgi:hypothetical protein